MSVRIKYANSSEIGAYARLTNTYCILPNCENTEYLARFKEMVDVPIIQTSIAGTDLVGRLTVGNSKGLIVPSTTTEYEYDKLLEELPDGVGLTMIPEKFSALGNVIACNDSFALVHPEIDKETIKAIKETLKVEVFPMTIAGESLVGTYAVFNNRGGVISSKAQFEEISTISHKLGIDLVSSTINGGSDLVNAGIAVNDRCMFYGSDTTAMETSTLTRVFKLDDLTLNEVDIDSLQFY